MDRPTPDALAIEFSRVIKTAERLGLDPVDNHRFTQKSVLLTGDPDYLGTPAGRLIALFALRFLVRICRNVRVCLPTGSPRLRPDQPEPVHLLSVELAAEAERIAFAAPVQFQQDADIHNFDAILSIGHRTYPESLVTVVNTRNWVVNVSSTESGIPEGNATPNPVAAMAAAAMGSGEVFKRLIGLKPSRGHYLDAVSFSLYDYSSGNDIVDEGPSLSSLACSVLLVGCGAIGNGVVAILAELASQGLLGGRIAIVDNQSYGSENLGTCVLIGPREVEAAKPKATFAEEFLNAALRRGNGGKTLSVKGHVKRIEDFVREMPDEDAPVVVLNGLDNVQARRVSQALWPEMMIDGAIGDSMCQVSRHAGTGDEACVRCLFQEEGNDESAAAITAKETGLSPERALADDVITTEDVHHAPREKRGFLSSKVGHRIRDVVCARMSARAAENLSAETQAQGFEPSVPFVACLSSAMVCSELIKSAYGLQSSLECRFQFDFLWGPDNGLMFPESPRQDCDCVTRARNIRRLRALRAQIRQRLPIDIAPLQGHLPI